MSYYFKCISCKKEYSKDEVEYFCPTCGDRMGTLEILYDYQNIKISKNQFSKSNNIWQFESLLPLDKDDYKTHLHVGGTPLYKFSNFKGLNQVMIKNDGSNPTASFKDRATAVAVAKAIGKKYEAIFCASTGNAASSLAGLTAGTPLKSYIFVPAKAPIAKISQLFAYGSTVIPIDGTYDEAFDISLTVGVKNGWYCRNSAYNPFLLEGKKTCALEIAVQCDWEIPDVIVVPVGDGTVISSFYKGFYDLNKVGAIDKIPKIIGVQARNSNSIKIAFDKGEPFEAHDIDDSSTVADSISVCKPRDVIKACTYMKACGGEFIEVEDDEIIESSLEMAKSTGVFGEPAGATSFAGLKKLIENNKLSGTEKVCLVVSGNGLKDIKSIEKHVNITPVVPDVEKVLEYIKSRV